MTDLGSPQQTASDEPLPLIVWLDTAMHLCAEFTMDADDVMQELGIKRSRLTQISGKELRVGRLRIDKYTKPFYRSCDVAAYKSWTRATASHQSSAEAINSALAKLDQQVIDLNQTVVPPMAELKEEITASLTAGFGRSFKQQQHHFLGAMELLSKVVNRLEVTLGCERGNRVALIELLTESEKLARGSAQHSDESLTTLAELVTALGEVRQRLEAQEAQLHAQLAGLHEAITTGMQRLMDDGEKLRQDLTTTLNQQLGSWEQRIEARFCAQQEALLVGMTRMMEEERRLASEREQRLLAQMGSLQSSMLSAVVHSEEQSQHQQEWLEKRFEAWPTAQLKEGLWTDEQRLLLEEP